MPSSPPGLAWPAPVTILRWALSLGQPSPRASCSTVTPWPVTIWRSGWSAGSCGSGWTLGWWWSWHRAMGWPTPRAGPMVSGTQWGWSGRGQTPASAWTTAGGTVWCVTTCHAMSQNITSLHHQASQSGFVAIGKVWSVYFNWTEIELLCDFQSMLCWFDFSLEMNY